MAEGDNLEDLRKELTKVTLDIFRLCGERQELAKKVAKIKIRENMPVENPKIEEELRNRVHSVCQTYSMNKRFCIELLELLLDESKRIQKDILQSKP